MQVMTLNWIDIERYMVERFDKDADVKAVLFVIGMREYGHKKQKFTKEEKQDLMNLAACKVMSLDGYFEVSHLDSEGWPVWKQAKAMPPMTPTDQEEFLKEHIISYFETENLI
jgi:hypothetical protein